MSTERRARADDGLWIVGLVGRAGSGKSTVAQSLAASGAELIEADRIGHQVTDTDPEVRAALIAEYGPDIYRADGALDRARVGQRVFADRAALERLNRLVHPRILRAMRARIAELQTRGFPGTVVVDAALMLDWEFERECDTVIAVVAPEALQISRLVAARGWSEAQARARLAAQRTNE
ncbi:MAG: dephospho-CoA kinase, partial [Candidatus Eiseniibacteriota bacterium]